MHRKLLMTGLVVGLWAGCGEEETTPIEEIGCSILSPAADDVAHEQLSVQIGLDGPVVRVELLVAGAVVATTDVPEPMRSVSLEWNTATGADGAVELSARAYDARETEAVAEPVTVVVDNTAPVVAMGVDRYALIRGNGPVALAIDEPHLATVRVTSDLVGVVYDGPAEAAAPEFTWDTTTAEDRIHKLTVTATDAVGHTATLADFPVIVANHGEEFEVEYDPGARVFVPANYATAEYDTRAFVPSHEGVFRLISWMTWDPTAGWTMEYSIGEGMCPHRGIAFTYAESNTGEVVIELSRDMLPSSIINLFPEEDRRTTTFPSNDDPLTFGSFFAHIRPLNPADFVDQTVPIEVHWVLIDEPPTA